MTHVLTLIANPSTRDLTSDLVGQAQSELPSPNEPVWLSDNIACDIAFSLSSGANLNQLEAQIRARINAPIDVALQPLEGRLKRLLIADMDSTIIEQECIDELGAAFGLGDKIADITERAMRGEINFESALRVRVQLLKNLPAKTIDDLLIHNITLMLGAETLIATMRKMDAKTILVSGGFSQFAGPIAKRVGFDDFRANQLEIENDRLTGEVRAPILGQDAKKAALFEYCARAGIGPEQALAVGDGANDLAMIKAAGLGVAYHAKPKVAEAADIRIDHGDLTALLYLQGIHEAEFGHQNNVKNPTR